MAVPSSSSRLYGLWQPLSHLKNLFYGLSCVEKHMLSVIPSISSKVLILTGRSIATKTPLVQQLESLLGTHHTATFSEIEQHGQVHGVNQAFEIVLNDSSIDTIVSIGGGSPIDSAKTISHRIHEERGTTLTHIAIPTTLSAAECTAAGGYTNEEGVKIGFHLSVMGIQTVFYDPTFAKYTPTKLWIGTGMRAVDHAVECFYHTNASEMPWKVLSFWALSILFECLPKSLSNPDDEEVTTKLRLAAFASAGFRGKNVKGGMGLSYSLGHALGSPYGIPHGETSCLTLGPVVIFEARCSPQDAKQIARLLPATGGEPSGDDLQDAIEVGKKITELAHKLGFGWTLTEKGVGKDQIPIIVRALRAARKKVRCTMQSLPWLKDFTR